MDEKIIMQNITKSKRINTNMVKERHIALYFTKKQVMRMLGVGAKTLETLALPFCSIKICDGKYRRDIIYANDFIYWLCSQYKMHYIDKNKLEILMNKKISDFFTL